jgi:hypothetical protein
MLKRTKGATHYSCEIMLKVLLTLDYEIHGNGDGCPYELMIEPTRRMMDLFERYGAKLTIMADVAEILKFREYRDQFGRDDYHYESLVAQLKDAIRRGHDVQLHLHCSYFNARFEHGKWVQDWSEYDFAGLSERRLNEVLCIGTNFLEEQLRPVDASYKCRIFRAANWAVKPSRNVVRALVNNGFQVDTSVFKYGRREGIVNFDYSNAFSNMQAWRAAEEDICLKDHNGQLVEIPIYAEQRWIGAFFSLQRFQRAWHSWHHRLVSPSGLSTPEKASSVRKSNHLSRTLQLALGKHPWKADFNQCSGRQLVRAIRHAAQVHDKVGKSLPFVLIGHSKLFTRFNEWSLRPFLSFVSSNKSRFEFATFDQLELSEPIAVSATA